MDIKEFSFDDLFVMCYSRYFNSVTRYISSLIFNEHISEEIAQDVFMKAYEKADAENIYLEKLRNFIFTIARNKAFDHIKKEKLEAKKYREYHFQEAEMDAGFYTDLESYCIDGEIISTLNDTINSFPEAQRNLYIDIFINKKQVKTISSDYHISVYKIRKIIREINEKIKDELGPLMETVN